jgi:two-component system, NarL family, nitrate/nitrite response regulator NarL
LVKVMIADDHVLLRQVVREVIEKEQDLEVVAEAADGQEAELRAAETQPDVILMDLSMPICDGFEATERVLACSPHSRVVIFSASDEEQHILRALQQGAIGYITKDVSAEGLLTAIRRAARNELFMTQPLSTRLLAHLRTLTFETAQSQLSTYSRRITEPKLTTGTVPKRKRRKRHLPLSKREREVLNLMRKGQRNKEIAHELRIAESTVHKHIQNIFEKLNARNRAEAVFLTKI